MIGMVLLRPGWERDYEGRPPIYAIGCSGVITHAEQLPDGRYNIVLRGVERFRILREDHVAGLQARAGRGDRLKARSNASDRADDPEQSRQAGIVARAGRRKGRRRPENAGGHVRRGSRQRPRAVSRTRAAREAGPARAAVSPQPGGVARRAARDEDDGGAGRRARRTSRTDADRTPGMPASAHPVNAFQGGPV